MLSCCHRATSPFVPKPWAGKVPIQSARHMADDPKVGRQGLPLQKHTAISLLNGNFITKRWKQPQLVAGPACADTMPCAHRNTAPAHQAAWYTRGEETLEVCKNPQAPASHFAVPSSWVATVGEAASPCLQGWSILDLCQGSLPHPHPREAGTLSQDKDAAGHSVGRVTLAFAQRDADSRHHGSVSARQQQVSVLRN